MNKYFSIIIAAILFVSGSLLTSCSNEAVNDEGTKKLVKQIVIRVKTEDVSWTSLDPKTRFTQTLPNGGSGKPIYAFEVGDELNACVEGDYYSTPNNRKFSYASVSCLEVKDGYAIFTGDIPFDFWANNMNVPTEEPLYFVLSSPFSVDRGLDYYTGLWELTQENNNIFVGSQLTGYKSDDPKHSYLYAKASGLINVDGDKNPTTMWADVNLNMARSYATIKVTQDMLSTIMDDGSAKIDVDCDNNALFPQYKKTDKYGQDQAPVNLEVLTGKVHGFYDTDDRTNHNTYTITKTELEDIINNYDGLISLPLYPGEYKNLKITVSTRAFMKDYTWSSNPVSFSVVIGSPSKVDDPANSVYSANRNFFFGNVTLAEKQ